MGCGLWVRCVMGFVAKVSARLGCGSGAMVGRGSMDIMGGPRTA